jgi:hypothetical protein
MIAEQPSDQEMAEQAQVTLGLLGRYWRQRMGMGRQAFEGTRKQHLVRQAHIALGTLYEGFHGGWRMSLVLAAEHIEDLKRSGLTEEVLGRLQFEAVRPHDIKLPGVRSAYRTKYSRSTESRIATSDGACSRQSKLRTDIHRSITRPRDQTRMSACLPSSSGRTSPEIQVA